MKMIKFGKRKILFVFFTLLIITTYILAENSISSASNYSTIRVGLYYGSKAVSKIQMSSDGGLAFLKVNNMTESNLFDDSTKKSVIIEKDIIKNSNTGNFHIEVKGTYNSFMDAMIKAQELRNKGIQAYPSYLGKYCVLYGLFPSRETAQSQIEANANIISVDSCAIVQGTCNSVVVYDTENYTPCFLFDCNDENLRIKGMSDKIKVDNKFYRGSIEVRRISGSDMTVINIINLEQYLYGVVPSEIGANSHFEALKAQAVVARTYALNCIGKHNNYGFDICNTTHCQVYDGASVEVEKVNNAVDETAGQKVYYGDRLAQVFYFSSSGGMTENVKNVWGSEWPYLVSVEDKYESGKSYNYNWEKTFTSEEIKSIAAKSGKNIGEIVDLRIDKTSEAGRVTALTLIGTDGNYELLKEKCRTFFGLPSQLYTINKIGEKFETENLKVVDGIGRIINITIFGKKVISLNRLFEIGQTFKVLGSNGMKAYSISPSKYTSFKFVGKGWGHAVGMSQEGAKGMAEAGYNYIEILKHYFQGTEVKN